MTRLHRGPALLAPVMLALAVLALAALTPAAAARQSDTTLGIVGYAVPREALAEIIEAWQKTPQGKDVEFSQSYGASGDQARAVANGLRADVVHLSTGLDVGYLVKEGLVDATWDRQPYGGIVTHSVVVFAVRPGNPKKLRTWDDLVKPGVKVITANPFTSGAAKWNILAAYGAQRSLGKTDKQARAYVLRLFRNVAVQAKSGRDATNAFLSGEGDVLLTYENEALLSRKNGQDIQFTIPKQTMLIEAPIAVLRDSDDKDVANRFIRFTQSPTAQRIWAEWGFRPVDKAVAKEFRARFPSRPTIFTIAQDWFGGWAAADAKWFDPDGSIMVEIEKAIGGPTS